MLREFIERATAAFKPPSFNDRLLNSTGGIRVGNTSFIYNEENLKDAGMPKPIKKSRSEELHSKLLTEMHETYLKKNADYGNSFEESLDKHGALAAVIQMEHKMNRLNNLVSNEDDQRVVDESIVDTVMDLANYAVMTGVWLTKQREGDVKFYADNQEYTMAGADLDGDFVVDNSLIKEYEFNLQQNENDLLIGEISTETYWQNVNSIANKYGPKIRDLGYERVLDSEYHDSLRAAREKN